eukprot:CAMPEP_0201703894 /NCGR_PEP_ID=MMETSP0578-20130828/41131_1 /ASSEMBLY_ACC=CAM_ASM_000663 /TAXON_ID=267565 /ORGANISM="Skeletonema grethea, Strain CCMP 1804" /LENGTH=247 /DNA_ID=CAMNT_0048191799 /DNA_START=12 /DNA_END=755 /DNA_ORIENTATION=+
MTVIKHNLLSSPYKISKEDDEKEDVMEIEGEVEQGQQDKEEAVVAEEVTSEKAEKVSLSDEEPNEGNEGEKASSLDNSAISVELKVPIATNRNDKKGDDDEVAAADSAAAADVPSTSVQKSVENSQDNERNEDKSIRLQDGTLLFQPSSPPTFAFAAQKPKNNPSSQSSAKFPSFSSSSVVAAAPTLKLKDDASSLVPATPTDAMSEKASPDGHDGEKEEDAIMDVSVDNDDNRADVANVLLGLMGK